MLEKKLATLAELLHEAYLDLAREKESATRWFLECEALKVRIAELEAKQKGDIAI